MARRPRTTSTSFQLAAGTVKARAYTSPTLVLLAMDWPHGAAFVDFLGFAILRSPGFHPGEKDAFLFNKISFSAPTPNSQPVPVVKLNPCVPMVQSAEHWDRDDASDGLNRT